ncbi:MAG: ThuA domain-containing protein [Halobacteriaceae archaeon]
MADLRALVIGETTFGFHDFDDARPHLRAALERANVDPTLTTDRDELRDLAGYDVVVDYLTDSDLTDAQRDGLLTFVGDGGGYAGVHCASDLTSVAGPDGELEHVESPFPGLRAMLGGHFLGHPEQQDIDVDVTDTGHPITAGVPDFTVYDEPYDLDVDDDVTVLARMDHPESGDVPVAWAKRYGRGRVTYCSLGHTEDALTDDVVAALVGRGARWAAGALADPR